MADYKGKTYSGIAKDGKLEISDGSKFTTPSAAGVHTITGHANNGWRFWKCKLPGASQFVLIATARESVLARAALPLCVLAWLPPGGWGDRF
jgi:hypothetical protein